MRRAIRADYEQDFLLPPSLEDWIGAEHPARFIREFVEALDLAQLGFATHESPQGGEYFTSELLVKVWLYGYFRRLRSTRALELGCRNEVGLIWLCGGGRTPDHNTLWRFFATQKEALRALFGQSVQVALRLDLVGLALQAIDGTKIQAACSGRLAGDEKANRKLLAALAQSITEQEEAIAAAERAAVPLAAALPARLQGAKVLRAKVSAALAEMAQSGRRHCHPREPEARRLPCEGRNHFGYNGQVVVDQKEQIIVAAEVWAQENDQGLLVPMAAAARAHTGACVPSVADGGYASSAQFAQAESAGHEVITPLPPASRHGEEGAFHARHFRHETQGDVVRCPQGRALPLLRVRFRHGVRLRVYRNAAVCRGCPVRSQCTRDRHGRTIEIGPHQGALLRQRAKLQSARVQRQLRQRGRIVEPVFAQIKANGGFRRWSQHGLEAVRVQWSLLCTSWNLQVLYRHWAKAG